MKDFYLQHHSLIVTTVIAFFVGLALAITILAIAYPEGVCPFLSFSSVKELPAVCLKYYLNP